MAPLVAMVGGPAVAAMLAMTGVSVAGLGLSQWQHMQNAAAAEKAKKEAKEESEEFKKQQEASLALQKQMMWLSIIGIVISGIMVFMFFMMSRKPE